MKLVKNILGDVCGLSAFCFFIAAIADDRHRTALVVTGFILCAGAYILLRDKDKAEKKKEEKEQKKRTCTFYGTHVSGLDVGEANLEVNISEYGVLITARTFGKNFKISLDKIENMGYYNASTVEKYLKKSFAKGVVGAVTFGVPGAIIGSRPVEGKTTTVKSFLVINCIEDRQIVIESGYFPEVSRFIQTFKILKPEAAEETIIDV